jgi:hypothetical protein
MIQLDIRGMAEVQAALRNLAEEQMPFAMATAINSTAFAVQKFEKERIASVFDRPTPLIQNAFRVEKATKQSLTSKVYIDPKRSALSPHERSGSRGLKGFERVLRDKGWLPSGYRAVPSRSMALDSYGNPLRAEINRLMKWAQGVTGFSGQRTKTQRYFCIPVGSRAALSPGLWLEAKGSSGKGAGGYRMRKAIPLLLFVSGVKYRERLEFVTTAEQEARRLLPDAMAAAVQRAIDTAR